MPKVNRTRFAVLGMLLSGPKSGYDVKQEFEERLGHFWSESLGQIYPALHRLHDDGLVSVKVEQRARRPERKLYRITKRGRDEFRAWLAEPAAPVGVRNELLLKLYFGSQMDPSQALEHIERCEAHQMQLRSLFKAFESEIEREAASREQLVYWRVALLSGQHVNRARLAWCRDARAALESLMNEQGAAPSEKSHA